VGGTSITDNYHQYSTTGGNIITGTPGRILDFKNRYNDIEQKHHQQQNNIFRKLEVLILDEADTLLDMGFKETINQILEYLPKQRRTGLFSATQNKEVRELIRAGLRNPCLISVKVDNNNNKRNNNNNMKINNDTNLNNNDKKNTTTDTPNTYSDDKILKSSSSSSQSIPTTLDNYYIISEHENRVEILLSLFLQHRHEKIIVFCATCACVEYYSYFFEKLFKDKLLFKSYRSDNNDDSNNNSNGDSDNNSYNNDENKRCFTSNDDYKNNDSSGNANCNSGNSSNKNDNNNDNNNNNNNDNNSNSSNCNYQIISFHGKMIPKKRNALYKKFVKMTTGGVMFSTDVAARGIDIPDVDWIIQLSSPKDPAFFIHRIGRTARAGKCGSAILFITLEEISYIELLKGRGVPLKEMNGNNIKEMLRLYRYNDIDDSSNNYNDNNNNSIKDEINF